MYKKYFISGSHGVGKTTLINVLDELGYNTAPEAAREVLEDNSGIMDDIGLQKRIFDKNLELVLEEYEIYDRSIIDSLAYCRVNCNRDSKFREEYEREYELIMNNLIIIKKNCNFYIPIEFGMKNDGFRVIDEDYRREVDGAIRDIYNELNIPYITVDGSQDDRLRKILKYI